MADKYISWGANASQEKEAIVVSAGADDAGKIPALGVDGKLDDSVINSQAIRTDSSIRLVAEVSDSVPLDPVNGQIYYFSTEKKFKGYADGAWV